MMAIMNDTQRTSDKYIKYTIGNIVHSVRVDTPTNKPLKFVFQDTFNDEMYNLDNDSFLNSLEAMAINWPDYGNGSNRSNDSDV
jgi:hypothetical protein